MFDINIVVVGNVLTAPEWRRTASTNALVANFRVASTARRMDKETGRWVDGNHFRVRVNCWRRLAEGVASSVTVGDPVVVAGRLYTRDWTDSEGNLRTTYEMEAVSVGHDLSRGRGRFFRNKPTAASATETAEAEGQIRGEAARPVAEDEAPAVYGDGVLDGDEPTFEDVPAPVADGAEAVAALRGGSIEPFDTMMAIPAGDPEPASDASERPPAPDPAPAPDTGSDGAPAQGEAPARRASRSRSSRRQPVPA
ncbi:single-stranded DNA-binding protein [Actinoplanes sp. NPDC049599]|uniref:single-stranded DNA-binding protein n=1 Tax=Actinoplanes sp. NPDC049599 TaxID=3363903 RepID=UPI00379B469D